MVRTLLLAVLMALLLALPVSATELQRVQAETQDNAATTKITDANATPTGGTLNALRYDDPTTITYPVTVAAGDTVQNIIVRSRGNANNTQAVTINVVVDGTAQVAKSIGKSAVLYQDRSWPVNISGGSHNIGVRLTNAPSNNKIVTDYVVIDGTSEPPPPTFGCNGVANCVDINPGDDIDAKANGAPAGTTKIFVHAAAGATHASPTVYQASTPVDINGGVLFQGEPGSIATIGPATYGQPVVEIKPTATPPGTLVRPQGAADIEWLHLDATGINTAITAVNGNDQVVYKYMELEGALGSCLGQAWGTFLNGEAHGCGTDSVGHDGTAAALKFNHFSEIGFSYLHDNPGNGVWCDVGCTSSAAFPNGWYVHDNVAVRNQRHGIFYENAPKPSINPTDFVFATITRNYVAGNTKSEISVSDSQNAEVFNNDTGILPGGAVLKSPTNDGIEIHSSGDTTRGQQKNANIHDNRLHGEIIDGTGTDQDGTPQNGCGDNGNVCTNNS